MEVQRKKGNIIKKYSVLLKDSLMSKDEMEADFRTIINKNSVNHTIIHILHIET